MDPLAGLVVSALAIREGREAGTSGALAQMMTIIMLLLVAFMRL